MTPVAPRQIAHVDMDAFFASVELRDDPGLRGKPVLVGGAGRRGVVAAASYEARKYGCRSAMPMSQALRRCPHAVVVRPRGSAYAEASRQVFEVFDEFSPLVEGLSIDEAFLDLSGTQQLFGSIQIVVEKIRARVFERVHLTCSVGVATTKFLAKIASDENKPDGARILAPEEELSFLQGLPLARLWGVGPKFLEKLHALGLRRVGDLERLGAKGLSERFGAHGEHLWELSQNRDPRPVHPGRGAKSIGHEDTVGEDLVGHEALRLALLSQATRVADRLEAQKWRARVVQLKIRDTEFETQTRQCTLPRPTRDRRVIYQAACSLLDKVEIDGRRFRLTGVSVSGLSDEDGGDAGSDGPGPAQQLGLFGEAPEELKQREGEELQSVLSEVRSRFGTKALYPGALDGRERTVRDDEGPDATPIQHPEQQLGSVSGPSTERAVEAAQASRGRSRKSRRR